MGKSYLGDAIVQQVCFNFHGELPFTATIALMPGLGAAALLTDKKKK